MVIVPFSFTHPGDQKKMRSVVITAAGNSTRFGENKLLLEILGKPIIVRTVEQFTKCPQIDEIIVATRKQDILY